MNARFEKIDTISQESCPEIVLKHYLEKYKTLGNTLTDIAIDNLPFLEETEPEYNMKGEKVSKSWFAPNGKEAARLVYSKIIKDYIYNDVVYNNVFQGFNKKLLYLDWAGNIAYSKNIKPYKFNLKPIFVGDDSETIIGFSSKRQRKALKEERLNADDYLQVWNPYLYATFYEKYQKEYNCYLRTGDKKKILRQLNTESEPEYLKLLNKVVGMGSMTLKELIIMNFQ